MPVSADRTDALVDTSVAVALSVADHVHHGAVQSATNRLRLGLAGHATFETYSVLTRLPGAARRDPSVVRRLLDQNFPVRCFLPESIQADLLEEFPRIGISGGSVYDALVGAAARHHALTLLTCDQRALRTYQALGVDVQIITSPSAGATSPG